jgi:2-polyprenyl-6-methoxyphenol hydroxylase-like FAD-dependent oxidoreductase
MARAVVLGAGIGGLTSAVALARAGWRVTLVERAPSLDPVGAGLGVAPNALHALDALGLGDALRARATIQGDAGLRRPDGRWIYRTSMASVRQRFGDPLVVVLRSDLVDVLTSALPDGALRLGSEVASVGLRKGDVELTDGTGFSADLVVAADGVRSATRALAFPAHTRLRTVPAVAWRFLAPRPDALVPAETWGTGAMVGVVPLADGRVYTYAALAVPPDAEVPPLPAFDGWHDPIPQLFATAQDVIPGRLQELERPLPAMHSGRVAFVGDAAHPMTPFLAQGACQAMEDAVSLARLVDPVDVVDSLAAYSLARLARTQRIVRRSRRVGDTILRPGRVGAAVRDRVAALARLLPDDVLVRSFDGVFTWQPPTAPVGSAPAG